MDSRRGIFSKGLIGTVVSTCVLLAIPTHAQITEPNAKQVKDGYPTGNMEQWLAEPTAYAWNPVNLRQGNHPDRPDGVTYIFPDAASADSWWNGVGTPPNEIPDAAVAYIHWALDNGTGTFPGIMAKSDVDGFKTHNCIMASGAVIPPAVEGDAPLVKTCDNPQGSSKRFKMAVMKADTPIDMVFNLEPAPLTYENYISLPTFDGVEESARIYRLIQKWGNATGTDTANSGPITGTRIVGFNMQLGYGTGATFTAVANGSKEAQGLGYELRPCMPDQFFDVLRDDTGGTNQCSDAIDSTGQPIRQEIWLEEEFATFSPAMYSTITDTRTDPVGGFWDKIDAGISYPEIQSESIIDSGSSVNALGYRGTTTPNYYQVPVTQGLGADPVISGNVFGYLMDYGVLHDDDLETLAQGIYMDDDGDAATEGSLLAWWDGVNYRYGIDKDSDGVIDEDTFGIVPDSELAYMATRPLDEHEILPPPRFEVGIIDDLAGLNVDTFIYLGRNFDVTTQPTFTVRMVAQSVTAAGADGDAGNQLPDWYTKPAPPLTDFIPGNGDGAVSIVVATERDDIGLGVVDGNARGDALPIMVTVSNVRSGELESVELAAGATEGSFEATLASVNSDTSDGNDNGTMAIVAGDVLEANYIDADDGMGNTDVLKQDRATVAAYGTEPPPIVPGPDPGPDPIPGVVPESKVRGGWCAYDPNGKFDPVLPAMLFISLAVIGVRRRKYDTV